MTAAPRRTRELRWLAALPITMILAIAPMFLGLAATIVVAHNPASGYQAWSSSRIDSGKSFYQFAASVPPWLQPLMDDVLQDHWSNANTNNSDTIRFQWSSSGAARVRFLDDSRCADFEEGWLGCTDDWGTNSWKITLRSDPNYRWCQGPGTGSPCWDVKRIGIHEVAHAAGFLYDSTTANETNSIMNDPHTGSQTHLIKRCDEARLQLIYGPASLSGPYPLCYDHIANAGTNGLVTALTASPSATVVCVGDPVTISGRLQVGTFSSYGALVGVGLAGRKVKVDRGSTVGYAEDIVDGTSGTNWDVQVNYTVQTTASFSFKAHFDEPDEEGLDGKQTGSFTVTWVRDVDC